VLMLSALSILFALNVVPGVPRALPRPAPLTSLALIVTLATCFPARRFQRYAPVQTRSLREVTLAFLGPCTWMPVR